MLRLALPSAKRVFSSPLICSFRSPLFARRSFSAAANAVAGGKQEKWRFGKQAKKEIGSPIHDSEKSTTKLDTDSTTRPNTEDSANDKEEDGKIITMQLQDEGQEGKETKEELMEPVEVRDRRLRRYYNLQMFQALLSSIDDVFKICQEMKQAGVKPDSAIMHLLISAYARIRCSDEAFIMFDQMLQMNIRPNASTLEQLLTVCDVNAEMWRAQQIVQRMRDFDVWPNMASHSYLISIYVKNKEHELAWAEYEAMKALNNATIPDVLGNIFRLVLNNRDPEWTYNVLLEMYNNQIEYTRYEIIKSLEIFLLAKDLKGCLLLFQIEGSTLQEGTLVKVLSLAAHRRDVEACQKVFKAIQTVTDGAPSRMAYFALLTACIYTHDIEGFLERVNDMTLAGHKLGGVYASQFARICDTPRKLDAARKHLDALRTQDKHVGVDALSALMRACARAGEMDRALSLFGECLNKYKLVPDIEGFNSIIEASETAGKVDAALNVIDQMEQHGVQPTVASYESLIRTCVAQSDLSHATEALSKMATTGLQPTYQIYAGLVSLCGSLGEYVQANAIINSMLAAGMKPAESLVLSVQPFQKKISAASVDEKSVSG